MKLGKEIVDGINETDCQLKKDQTRINVTSDKNQRQIINFDRFSSWSRLKNTVCWVHKLLNRLRAKTPGTRQFLLEEQTRGENTVIKLVQIEAFKSEINFLESQTAVHKTSRIKNLDPFIDQKGMYIESR